MIEIHNSLVCLRVRYCVHLLPEVFFFDIFPLPFPLLKFVSFYLASFFLESKPRAFQRSSFSQAKKNEWSWYTIVWFVWGYTIVSSCFLRWFCFLTFPLKCSISQNIWCFIKTQLKNITQTIFQGGSPWATLIHNSLVCLRVHYCVQLLPEVMFFSTISFSFAKVCFLLFSFIFLGIKTKGFPKD